MNNKGKYSPEHARWHRIIEGQIRDCMFQHPEFFNPKADKKVLINSLAKRIVGEVLAKRNKLPESTA